MILKKEIERKILKMIYISNRLKIRLDECFNVDFNDAKISLQVKNKYIFLTLVF